MGREGSSHCTSLKFLGVLKPDLGYSNMNTIASRSDGVCPSMSATYGNDAVDRLTSVGSSGAQSFGCCTAGNRSAQSRQGATHGHAIDGSSNLSNVFNAPGLSRSFNYDASGSLKTESRSDGTRTYAYDAFDRLITADPK
jgi:YD repeat-containing protein